MVSTKQEEKHSGERKYVHTTKALAEVTGNNLLVAQNVLQETGDVKPGAMIGNLTNSVFSQHPPREKGGLWSGKQVEGHILLKGDEIRNNQFYQGDGNDILVMKNGKGITGNTFHAGKEGGVHPIDYALGLTPLKADPNTIVLPGDRKDYEFTFDKDHTNKFKIKHLASGAENEFENYNYIVFGGPKNLRPDYSKYIEVAKIKAEQATKAVAEKTPGTIPPGSSPESAVGAFSAYIAQCGKDGEKLAQELEALDKKFPGVLDSMEHAGSESKAAPLTVARKKVEECVKRGTPG